MKKGDGIKKIKGGMAILNVTSFCNADCIFCSEGEHLRPENISFGVIKNTVLRLKKQGVKEINFMGGEVAIRKDIIEIIEFIKKQKMTAQIVSNGMVFADPVFAKKIMATLDSLEISFHAHSRASFKGLMGVDGFERQLVGIKNIKRFNKRKIPIFFNFVTNRINLPHITKALKKINSLMAGSLFFVHIKCLDIEGKAEDDPKLFPDFEKQKKYILQAAKYASKNGIRIIISRLPFCFYSGYEYFSLELALYHRANEIYFYNQKMLERGASFKPSSIITHGDLNSSRIRQCQGCSFAYFCPAIDGNSLRYLGTNDLKFLKKQSTPGQKIVNEMKKKSPFYKMDKYCHKYIFSA
jgi:MoaA/NifB/PqqE/SkfB family radical SAM enzyme